MHGHDTNGNTDIFYSRASDSYTLISKNTGGTDPGNDGSSIVDFSVISDDGRYVAFDSVANDIVANDTNTRRDAFLHDTTTGTNIRISTGAGGGPAGGNGDTNKTIFSTGGSTVVMHTGMTNLVAVLPDMSMDFDFIAYNVQTMTKEMVTVNAAQDVCVTDASTLLPGFFTNSGGGGGHCSLGPTTAGPASRRPVAATGLYTGLGSVGDAPQERYR